MRPWHWIFLINLPIGLGGIFPGDALHRNVRADKVEPFDFVGIDAGRSGRRPWRSA